MASDPPSDSAATDRSRGDSGLLVTARGDSDKLLNRVLDGRYRIDQLIGTGGMGRVYRGTQLSVDRPVAIKVLRTESLVRQQAVKKRFFREARVVSSFNHPNIVSLVDFGHEEELDLLYLVMEYVEGELLADVLKRGRLQLSFALEIVYQVCGALAEAHAEGIIHRDLKPENLMLVTSRDGSIKVKVLDFGIAYLETADTQLTSTGAICGTAMYMAPEQIRDRELTPRTDLYSLGVMIFELLTGQSPFEAETLIQLMIKHVQSPPRSLRGMLPRGSVPFPIIQLVDSMLAKSPGLRPASARAIRQTIEDVVREHRLKPVRIDPSLPSDQRFDEYLLDPLPQSPGSGSTAPGAPGMPIDSDLTLPEQGSTDPNAATLVDQPSQQLHRALADLDDAPSPGTVPRPEPSPKPELSPKREPEPEVAAEPAPDVSAERVASVGRRRVYLGLAALAALGLAVGAYVLGSGLRGETEAVPAATAPPPATAGPAQEIDAQPEALPVVLTQIEEAIAEQRYGAAHEMLESIDDHLRDSPEFLSRAATLRSEIKEGQALLEARRFDKQNRIVEAIAAYRRVLSIDPHEDEVAARLAELEDSSVLKIDSNVEAVVWIDGERVGTTPYEQVLTPASVRIRLEAEGYAPWEKVASLPGGEELVLTPTLSLETTPRPRPRRSRPEPILPVDPTEAPVPGDDSRPGFDDIFMPMNNE